MPAAEFLKRHGYHILARSLDSPLGELDIVAVDGRTVVFVEVKTRSSNDAGHPDEAIDSRKEQRMTQAALAYLKSNRLLNYSSRFDVVAITWPDDAGSRRSSTTRMPFRRWARVSFSADAGVTAGRTLVTVGDVPQRFDAAIQYNPFVGSWQNHDRIRAVGFLIIIRACRLITDFEDAEYDCIFRFS